MYNKHKIWVLADNRVGNVNQAIALAEKINFGYQLKPIEYNFWSNLPNFLLISNPIHVKNELLQSWKMTGLPNLIISSGRRTASLASYLKHKYDNKIKIVQIMHPNLSFKQFDFIILPQHDKLSQEELNNSNILRITGALNNVQAKIQAEGIKLRKNYPNLKQFISVIIGGSSKNYHFINKNAYELATILSNLTKKVAGCYNLFISFSRRTPNSAKQIIKNNISSSDIIYDPTNEATESNFYFGMLAEADYIISTADSISMCSEASSTGKPLYIFCPNNFKLPKHISFIQKLVELGIERILNKSVTILEQYSYTPLNEVEKIANIIISKNWVCL